MLVTQANAVDGGTTPATRLYQQLDQSIRLTDGMTVASLSASLQDVLSLPNCVKLKIITNSKSGVNFQVSLKQNHAERNCINLPCLYFFIECFYRDMYEPLWNIQIG